MPPIGTITPGSPTTVTADASPAAVTSIQVPSPTMGVQADNLAQLALALMNIKARSLDRISGGDLDGIFTLKSGAVLQAELGSILTIIAGASSSLDWRGPATFSGEVDFTGPVKILVASLLLSSTGVSMVGSGLTLDAASSITNGGVITNSVAGHINERVGTLSLDADQAIGIDNADVVYCPSGFLTADRKLTIADLGAARGSRMRVFNLDTSHGLNVVNGDNSAVGPTFIKKSGGFYHWIDIVNLGGANAWRYCGGQLLP
jgi:hypothetical protein